jgi:SulP family sulfate permease
MFDVALNSPRGLFLNQVAATTLQEEGETSPYTAMHQRVAKFPRPLGLLRLAFQGMTDKADDFWEVMCPYFTRAEYPASAVLYREGEVAQQFILLESGMLRAEYDTPQGSYFELIVAGRPCGELPFFSETRRTATVRAERGCVVWTMGRQEWEELRSNHPTVAGELMKVCLKLTTERMESITS